MSAAKKLQDALEALAMSRLKPPKYLRGDTTQFSIRLPVAMVARLDEIAGIRDQGRTELLAHFLNWALEQYDDELEQDGAPKKPAAK